MQSSMWKYNADYYFGYTEDADIMRRIRRYYDDFVLVAEYTNEEGKLTGRQYRIPIVRKRAARRLFGGTHTGLITASDASEYAED